MKKGLGRREPRTTLETLAHDERMELFLLPHTPWRYVSPITCQPSTHAYFDPLQQGGQRLDINTTLQTMLRFIHDNFRRSLVL